MAKEPSTFVALEFFSSLLALGALDIRIARYDKGDGIFHDKTGCFMDNQRNTVTFRGSTNETYMDGLSMEISSA